VADKKPMIVIKRIDGGGHGHHGGAWKVALADFMTAMMAFFLVMWLVSSSSEETKKNIAEYFSTPSVIEYQFQNYGAEITLEKLFTDFLNQPLDVVSNWLRDADQSRNDMIDVDNRQAVMEHITHILEDQALSVRVEKGLVEFELPDDLLFKKGTADPTPGFVKTMTTLISLIQGVKEADLYINSIVYIDSVANKRIDTADLIAEHRADVVSHVIRNKVNSKAVQITTKSYGLARSRTQTKEGGVVKFSLQRIPLQNFQLQAMRGNAKLQKPGVLQKTDEKSTDKLDKNDYDQFVEELTKQPNQK
jgi:chemotaxis protein MotB